jgi:Tfp pilus assembly protein PilE
MIVIAIIGIMFAIAYPAYRDYACVKNNECEGLSIERQELLKKKAEIKNNVDGTSANDIVVSAQIDDHDIEELHKRLSALEQEVSKEDVEDDKCNTLTILPKGEVTNLNRFYDGKLFIGKDGYKYVDINGEQFRIQ